MSRIEIPRKNPDLLVTVGWDPPLQTYFAQVGRHQGSDSDDLVLWLGTRFREHTRPEDLTPALSRYAELKPATVRQLHEDRHAEPAPHSPVMEALGLTPRLEPEVPRRTPRR